MEDFKSHWEKVYSSKHFEETSWYQKKPEASLNLIESLGLSRKAGIIDIGGGDSYLVDHLLDLDYENISVLDISEKAIQKAKLRLGARATKVNWIIKDVVNLETDKKFQVWHDRAAFHFLTDEKRRSAYIENLQNSLKDGGYFILSTFSEKGPKKCSGLEIDRYSQEEMQKLFEKHFEVVRIENLDHTTPTNTTQNFTFGLFRRK